MKSSPHRPTRHPRGANRREKKKAHANPCAGASPRSGPRGAPGSGGDSGRVARIFLFTKARHAAATAPAPPVPGKPTAASAGKRPRSGRHAPPGNRGWWQRGNRPAQHHRVAAAALRARGGSSPDRDADPCHGQGRQLLLLLLRRRLRLVLRHARHRRHAHRRWMRGRAG